MGEPGQSISEECFIPRFNRENSCDRAQCLTHVAGRVEHILHSCDVTQDLWA